MPEDEPRSETPRWRWWDERLGPVEKAATIVGVIVALLVAVGLLSRQPATPIQSPIAGSPSSTASRPGESPSLSVGRPSASLPLASLVPATAAAPWAYAATWTAGMDGWSTTTDWRVAGATLVNDGTTEEARAQPDFQPSTADYIVSADIELIRAGDCFWFGLEARLAGGRGYRAGIGNRPPNGGFCGATTVRLWDGHDAFIGKPFVPPAGVHHYELSVVGTSVRFAVDGSIKLQTQSTLYGDSGSVALWSSDSEIIVRPSGSRRSRWQLISRQAEGDPQCFGS